MLGTKPLIAGTLTVLLLGCSPRAEPDRDGSKLADAHEQAIRTVNAQWLGFIRDRDAVAISRIYTPDGALMAPGAQVAQGQSSIEESWRGLMETPGFDLTFTPDQILVASGGDMAMDRGTYRLSMKGPTGPTAEVGKYVVVWRNIGGEWKVAADIFNSDGIPTE